MTTGDLKKILANVPDNLILFVAERKTEFTYGCVNSAYVKKINFKDEPDGEVLATDTVFIFDED